MDFIQKMIAERYGEKPKTTSAPKKKEQPSKKVLIDKINYVLEQADRVDNDKADTLRKLVSVLEGNGKLESFIAYIKSDPISTKPKYKVVKTKKSGGWVSNHLVRVQ